jgi:uncharacterized repeat protein (TIGR01451 family)
MRQLCPSLRLLVIMAVLTAFPPAVCAGQLTLTWDFNNDGATGYRVFIGTASGSYGPAIDVGWVNEYVIPDLAPGRYYFVLTAYTADGHESEFSTEISCTVGATQSCAITLAESSRTMGATAAAGSIEVTAGSSCRWTASSDAGWLTLLSEPSGSGSGVIEYGVAENRSSAGRSASVRVGDQSFTVTQEGGSDWGPDLSISKTHSGSLVPRQTAHYVLTVTNTGSVPTARPIRVVDDLPSSLGFVAADGDGWSCLLSGQQLRCTILNPLAPGAGTSLMLTVLVAADAPAKVTNTASLSSFEDANPDNDRATDEASVGSGATDSAASAACPDALVETAAARSRLIEMPVDVAGYAAGNTSPLRLPPHESGPEPPPRIVRGVAAARRSSPL